MKKTIIMSVAVMATLLFGEILMSVVLGCVMLTGLFAGHFMSESARRVVECPVSALKPALKGHQAPPSA